MSAGERQQTVHAPTKPPKTQADRSPKTAAPAPDLPLRAADQLDPRAIIALQAFAGNSAVTSLLAPGRALQRQPAAAPAAPAAAPPAAGGPARASEDRRAITEQLHRDSMADAAAIRQILTGTTYLGSRPQAQIMAIVRKWAAIFPPAGIRMSGMDYLIAALRQNTYEVGVLVKQYTSAFDELHRRMDSDNVEEFKSLIATSGRAFKDEKPIELAKFEVSQEDIIRALQAGGELAAAMATGGASIVLQIISWLANTLPDLWNTLKSVFNVMDAIKSFRSSGVGSRFNPAALGALAVSALFGELQKLPILGGAEPPKAEESQGEASGLAKFLMMIVRGITVVKNAYNKIAGKVNAVLDSFNISAKPWFEKVAMVYAGLTTLLEKIGNPGAALKSLAENLKQQVGGLFGKVKEHIGEVVGDVKAKLELITDPGKLLGMVADRLVSTVLNFIITHPPSELVRTVFNVIQKAAGKDLIDVVREQLKPFGDEIIKKIADSHVVQTAISPLKGPVQMITDAIGKVTDKGLTAVKEVEEKVGGYLSEGNLRELAGLGPEAAEEAAPAVAQVAAEEPADFITVVKKGLHSHLMTIGMRKLIEAGKTLAKKGWEKVKGAAKAAVAGIKGAIVGKRVPFEAGGVEHSLWAEQSEQGPVLMVASKPTPLEEKIAEYEAAVKKTNRKENELKQLYFEIAESKKLKAEKGGEAAAAATQLEALEQRVKGLVKQLEALLVAGKQPEYHQDSRGRPMIAAATLQPKPAGNRDMAAESEVSKPLTQLFEYLEQQGGAWNVDSRPSFDAAHLIPHDFGGPPGKENLVPVEARVNRSYMKVAEDKIRSAVRSGGEFYAIVRCVYKDAPRDLAEAFETPGRSGINPQSSFKGKAEFNFMALELVPDEVSVKVIDLDSDKTVVDENYPTGGPIIDWIGKTRRALEKAGDPRAAQILDPEKRKALIEAQKI
jgi:hypothetical protein